MNNVALVTGAAGGVGQAVTRCLADAGWVVVAVSRSAERLKAAFAADYEQVVADCSTASG
ncbi:MAG: SDR family NAD(P)-dependent oxidoreductase, partial [Alcaligenaceae bacterium]|nr:SDR family NAD(P)-dependent oxidoreductase [Alcaligenaceae bacterium]